MHLPISSEDALYFYRYLHTHVLITDEHFLLLTNVPIQQLEMCGFFGLVIPHGNFSACYNINSRYLGITYDKTEAVEISEQQFCIFQKANGQFCNINGPLQPLANPPTCITTIYTKNKARIEKRCSLQIRNTNSVSIPTSIAPNIWILTSTPTAISTGIMLICLEESSKPRHPSTFFDYHQLAALHLNIFTYIMLRNS